MNKYKNFDEFFKTQEKEKQGLKITVYGKEYVLESELPASIFIKLYRGLKENDGNGVNELDQLDLAMKILGEENVIEWCNKGMTMEQLSEIINWVTEQLMPGGNSEAEGKKQRTS